MFEIDFQRDEPRMGTIIRIRDATRYVQDLMTDEMSLRMQGMEWIDRVALRQKFLEALCNKWFLQFGEHLRVVPPDQEGVMFAIVYQDAIEGEVYEDAERRSIEGG